METARQHKFDQDRNAIKVVCTCGRPPLDPVHTLDIKVIRGTAKPNYTSERGS